MSLFRKVLQRVEELNIFAEHCSIMVSFCKGKKLMLKTADKTNRIFALNIL
jgi:hypothetical protein